MLYDITNLEKTPHYSFQNLPLYVYQDLGTFRILTDGYYLYKEFPNRKGIEPFPIAEGLPNHILVEASPIDQFFMSLKEDVKQLAIAFIKTNPTCLLMDVIGYIEAQRDETCADLCKVLLEAYGKVGNSRGLFTFPDNATADQKFEILRDFIVNTPLEDLEDLLNS